jgi:hypothetical protein
MMGFGRDKWSGNTQLWMQGRAPGDYIELRVPADGPAPRKITIFATKSWDYGIVNFTVNGEQDAEPPWPFRKIHVHYAVGGSNIKPEDVEKAIKLSEEKYCSVSATLRQAVNITYDFEVFDTSPAMV